MKELKVKAIKNGTAIDHITPEKALQVIQILQPPTNHKVMIGINLISNKLDKKDIIKIENYELNPNEINSIALVAPKATVAIIKDYEVIKKISVKIPDNIGKLIICPNPKCITNIEHIETKFKTLRNKPIEVKCLYCEKEYTTDEVEIKI